MRDVPHALELLPQSIRVIDQTKLPANERWMELTSPAEVIASIRSLTIRGAPLIGVAGASAAWLALCRCDHAQFRDHFETECQRIEMARPTAINLRHAVDRIRTAVTPARSLEEARSRARAAVEELIQQESRASESMGQLGNDLIRTNERILTYCNTGRLATTGDGTALAVIYAAHRSSKNISVYACETRPLLQGARLTAWELARAQIPVTVLCDNTVGIAMTQGRIDRVLVGADRIASNGDTANKIGTYVVAVLAKRHGIPFHVVAPTTTFDLATANGSGIPIEERDENEVLTLAGQRIAATGASAYAPAFDVTPASLITSIVTERGIISTVDERTIRSHLA